MKLVLVHDRTDISPGVLDLLKDDLIAVISRHIEIDPEAVRIEMARDQAQRLEAREQRRQDCCGIGGRSGCHGLQRNVRCGAGKVARGLADMT